MMSIEVTGLDILEKWFEVSYETFWHDEGGSTMDFLIEIAGYFKQSYTLEKKVSHTLNGDSVIEHKLGGANSHRQGFHQLCQNNQF